jgi:hypothetical protein
LSKVAEHLQDFILESNIQLNPKNAKCLKLAKCSFIFQLTNESTGEIAQLGPYGKRTYKILRRSVGGREDKKDGGV